MGITISVIHRFFIMRTNLKPIKDLTKEMKTFGVHHGLGVACFWCS
jgi:hypothetical protein